MTTDSPESRPEARQCVCANCKYEWKGSYPVGTADMQCPQCNRPRGGFKYPFGPGQGDSGWNCSCGSTEFFIMRPSGESSGGVYCRGCGTKATGWFG